MVARSGCASPNRTAQLVIRGSDVVAEARNWVGTPWRHQGRLIGVGTDCLGLVGGIAVRLGLVPSDRWTTDPVFAGYGRVPVPEQLLGGCANYLDVVRKQETNLGDVLVMSFSKEKHPQHFAIVSRLEPMMYIIHAYAQRRMVVESQAALPKSSILRTYRFRGVTV